MQIHRAESALAQLTLQTPMLSWCASRAKTLQNHSNVAGCPILRLASCVQCCRSTHKKSALVLHEIESRRKTQTHENISSLFLSIVYLSETVSRIGRHLGLSHATYLSYGLIHCSFPLFLQLCAPVCIHSCFEHKQQLDAQISTAAGSLVFLFPSPGTVNRVFAPNHVLSSHFNDRHAVLRPGLWILLRTPLQ